MKEEETHQPQTSRPACMDEHIMLILTDTTHTHIRMLTQEITSFTVSMIGCYTICMNRQKAICINYSK